MTQSAHAKAKTQKGARHQSKRLVLLDANAILHRAYHALPDFSSQKGEPTGALYGLAAMLLKIIEDLKPDYLVACFDMAEPTHRHEAYEAYKAGRAKTDDELVAQIQRAHDVFAAFGIPIYEKAGFEADDILGTVVEEVTGRKDLDLIIASGDMDTLQLVDDKRVRVYTLKKGIRDTILYDEDAVKERFGFAPELLADFKGLRGDPSDNIIGIAGIGEKTATELIQHFGGIEDMYKKLKKDEKAFEQKGIKPRIVGLLKENEEEALFSKELATIRRDAPIDFALPEQTWREALDVSRVLSLFNELSFRTLAARVKQEFGQEPQGTEADVSFTQPPEEIDERELRETAVALWLLQSDTTNPTRDDILAYGKTDSFTEARATIMADLRANGLERVYEDIEKPLIPIIQRMTDRGIKIDRTRLAELSKTYHGELQKREKRIHKHAGEEFNINSPRQLATVLFDKLELGGRNLKKTATGMRSTRESELEKLRDAHPIIEEILQYRELQKLLSSYIDPLPDMLDDDNRLHASFSQTGTTTGRMSSQNPNLQNIPIRTDLGRAIREAFIAEKGFVLASFDYSQIELRVAAMLSGDDKLVEIFRTGGDIHTSVASEVFEVPPEHVDHEMRRRAKVINFGILYGMGVNALRANLGTSRAEAQEFLTDYFHKFSGLAHFIEHMKGEARRKGYTETLFGRRRYFEGINSPLPQIRSSAERMAVNAPIQGTQADIIKLAMVRIDAWIEERELREQVHLLLQVHDELVFEIAEKRIEEAGREIVGIMNSILSSDETSGIPLKVDAEAGESWGEMQKLSLQR